MLEIPSFQNISTHAIQIFAFESEYDLILPISLWTTALEMEQTRRSPSAVNSLFIDGLVQERRNSSANALELRLSCTNPLI